MPPSFGLATNPSIEILKEIRTIQRMGIDYVEIGIEAPEGKPQVLQRKMPQIMKLLKAFKTKPIGHTAHWIDLSSDYEHVRRGWILESRRILHIAEKLGLSQINFHANSNGMFYGKKRKMMLHNSITSLQEIVSYAKDLNIEVMLENMPRSSNGIHKLDEFRYIVKHVPDLQVHLDIPHAFTSGGMKSVLAYIRTFRHKLAHIHWHDNHGEFDEHLPIGAGLIDHRRVVKALKEIGYESRITLEVFTSKKDANRSAEKLKELWEA
ncbi:MAG: sugar phosphate isomerase/epimerase family protein [Nitrososphaerales archaeon]